MYKWLDAKVHNVETFNKIFNLSKIHGFKPEEKVLIGDLLTGERREVFVSGKIITMTLISDNLENKWLSEFKSESVDIKKPENLTLNEEKVFNYIKSKGVVEGQVLISKSIGLGLWTTGKIVKSLKDKGVLEMKSTGKGNTRLLVLKKPTFENPEFDNPAYRLNPSSFKVLMFIKEVGRASGVDFIAEKTNLGKKTVSIAMMELEERGLIRKIQNSKQKMIEFVDL
jgi:DNA-binding MarR family transcriptional regulator